MRFTRLPRVSLHLATLLGLLAVPSVQSTVLRELHFLMPALKAGQTATFKATVSTDAPSFFCCASVCSRIAS